MVDRPLRLLIPLLRLLLLLLSSAAISTTIFTLMFTSQTKTKDSLDNTDNLNETEIFLRLLNAPKTPTATTTIDPALSQVPSQHLQVTFILLFTAILANIVVIGMDAQRLIEDAGCSSGGGGGGGGGDLLELRIPATQRRIPLAQHRPEADDTGRVLGGVEAEGPVPALPQTLKRTRTRSDLSAVDISSGHPNTLNWGTRGLGLTEYSAEALRQRPQWISRRRGENYPGEP